MDGMGDARGAEALAGQAGLSGLRLRQPRGRWTADTERAFLAALRLCGQAKQAAREIGRSHGSAYQYRKRHPDFARRWDEAIAEQQREWIAAHQERLAARAPEFDDAGGGRLVPGWERAGGWDARKRGLYLRTLTRTKRVDAACEAAGMPASAVHYLRSKSPRFAAACEKALADPSPPSVIDAALARAVEGWDEPIIHGGQIVGYRKVYSEGLLRDLLKDEQARRAGDAAAAGKAAAVEVKLAEAALAGRSTEAELTEAILRGLALRAEQKREKAERQWERWRLGWVDAALAAPVPGEDEEDEDADWDEEED